MELKIYDDIVTTAEQDERSWWMSNGCGITFRDIDEFISQIPADDNNIDLLIHCCGGSVSEGWAIVDKLRATGKVITATIDGMCASMAVSIYLAASVRKAHQHATIHIHKPYFPEYSLWDAYNEDDLKKMAADLEAETNKMLDWYVERTGADRAVLEALMCEDKDINVTQAQDLGFVQEVVEPMSAALRRNKWNKHHNRKDMAQSKNSKEGILNALASLLGVKVNIEQDGNAAAAADNNAPAVNFVVKTTDGQELTIEKEEGQEIAVGDTASPDGEFILEDGRVVVVVGGVVTEIRPADTPAANAVSDENYAALQAENEALKAENEAFKAEVDKLKAEQTSAEDKAILEKVANAGGMEWLDKVAASNYTPAQRPATSKSKAINSMEERIATLKARQARN